MAQLKGAPELRRRLKAIRTVFKPVGRQWADRTVVLAKGKVKTRTGRTKRSIRRKNASQRKASVQATHGARFLEAGAKPHELKAKKFRAMKFTAGGQPTFAKKVRHPGSPKQPFLHESARKALDEERMLDELIELWNQAA